MNNFWVRTFSAFVYAGLVVGSILFDMRVFALLFAVITAVGLSEFYGHTIRQNKNLKYIGIIAGTTLYLAFSLSMLGIIAVPPSLIWFLLLPYLLLIMGLFNPHSDHFYNIGIFITGLIYIVVPLTLLAAIGKENSEGGVNMLLAIFILFWVNDTGSYLTGRQFGKRPLFYVISPKKTVEGLAGGVILTLIGGFVFSLYKSAYTLQDWLIIAAMISVFGALGDLVESMFKRNLGIKDSGTFIPGHGGVLDRFDGFFIAIPFVYAYLVWG